MDYEVNILNDRIVYRDVDGGLMNFSPSIMF